MIVNTLTSKHIFQVGLVKNHQLGVSKNSGTPKSSILIGFSIINHPFWGTPNFGNTHITFHFCQILAGLRQKDLTVVTLTRLAERSSSSSSRPLPQSRALAASNAEGAAGSVPPAFK